MDKSKNNGKKRQGWWRGLPGSSKAFIMIGVICLIILVAANYLIKMSGDPIAAAQLTLAINTIVVIVMTASVVVMRALDAANLESVCTSIVHQQKAEEARRKAEADFFLDMDDYEPMAFQDDDPEEDPEEQARRVEQIKADLQSYHSSQDTEDIIDRRYQREIAAHAAKQAKLAKEKAQETTRENPREPLGPQPIKKPTVATVEPIDVEAGTKIIAIISKIHTGEIEVHKVRAALAEAKIPLSTAKAKLEDMADDTAARAALKLLAAPSQPLLLEQKSEFAAQDPASNASNAEQPIEQSTLQAEVICVVTDEQIPEPDTWPSIGEQARELGVPEDILLYWLQGKLHYSQMPYVTLQKVRQIGKTLAG